jgi:hypothetical protein
MFVNNLESRKAKCGFRSHPFAAASAAFSLAVKIADAGTAEIKLLSSNAVKWVMDELKPQFETCLAGEGLEKRRITEYHFEMG